MVQLLSVDTEKSAMLEETSRDLKDIDSQENNGWLATVAIYRCCQCEFVSLDENMFDDHNKGYHSVPNMQGPNILPLLLPDTQAVLGETSEDVHDATPQEDLASLEQRSWYACTDCDYRTQYRNNWYVHKNKHEGAKENNSSRSL